MIWISGRSASVLAGQSRALPAPRANSGRVSRGTLRPERRSSRGRMAYVRLPVLPGFERFPLSACEV